MKLATPRPKSPELTLRIPGPDRKRNVAPYTYRVTYRAPDPRAVGCVAVWDVDGGRLPYQVALERTEAGELKWHCGCADAVYRGEKYDRYACKHVSGLTECLPLMD
jgi:hypothetical protein